MQHRTLPLILVLLLTGAGAAHAEAFAGGVGMPRLLAPSQGLMGLFQSPMRPPPAPAAMSAAPPAAATPAPRPAIPAGPGAASPGATCRVAIAAAEARHGLPPGLLAAIGTVESGRADPATGARLPWPWTTNAEGRGHFFDSAEAALAWTRQAQAGGIRSIDVGCLQVNLRHHPGAFASLEQAFDPAANADYAGRFLRDLHDTAANGDWMRAAGYYHSQTPELAEPYRRQVEAVLGRGLPAAPPAATQLAAAALPGTANAAGGGGGFLPNHAERMLLLPLQTGSVGRGLDAYRAAPILLAGRALMRAPVPAAARD